MTVMTHAEALVEAIRECMDEDDNVALVWGSLMGVGGNNDHVQHIKADFADRIFHPPISEAAIAAIATGAAMDGVRTIFPMGTASFMFRAWDQIIHEAGAAHYMSNGAVSIPAVFHVVHGLRGGGSVQHSQSPQSMLWNAPGIEIAMPSCPADAKGLMRTAIKSNNPTVFIDHQKLNKRSGEVPDGPYDIPFGVSDIKREGADVTIVAASLQVVHALEAAETLSAAGIEAEVVDLRSLVPLDEEAILTSVGKTGRLLVVDEAPPRCSVASEVVATVAEKGMDLLKAPPVRLNRLPVHVPANVTLEDFVGPNTDRIIEATKKLCG
ncbi:MAG: alpha-ketoacid dehydrogenase subunit beta [Alphaproteobacteria bacterium]|jgi:pyruvate/2-oxoglutarate/acetoin dehydrogenase E1 component